jgi:hypothetical protein
MDAKRDAEFEAEISLFEDHNADIPEPIFSAQITQLSRWRNQAWVLKKSVTVVPTLRKSRAAEMERLELEESTVVKIRDRTQNAHKICNPRGACGSCGSQNQQLIDNRARRMVQLRPWPPCFQLLASAHKAVSVPFCSKNFADAPGFASFY